ncbi:MAG: response regulator [Anaerolineales bacterium]|nr:response regulator [Anaerolineales bacterium]
MANNAAAHIRVLIVDDFAETRENIRKLLQFESDIDVVGMARTGREGIALAKETKPNVVLMDINMPDMDGIQATEIITKEVPIAQIVIVSVQSDTDYLRRAMLAGARDFLSKPPPADEMINTIRRLGEMSRQREALLASQPALSGPGGGARGRGGKVIAVFSPKGGAGCTTLVTNLAMALKSGDNKVMVVDANIQFGDVGVFLNLQGKFNLVSLTERADEIDEEWLQSVLTNHTASGVKVLLAPPTPEDAELVGAGQLKKVLESLREYYDYILVDTASVLRDVELTVFDVADRVVLVATPDIPSLANIKKFFDLIEKLEFPPEKMLLILNRVDRRGGITAANVEETLKHTVRGQILLDDKTVLASINSGVPFILSPNARQLAPVPGIFELAQRLKDDFNPKETAPAADDKGRKAPAKQSSLFARR